MSIGERSTTKILVIGASRGIGLETVRTALRAGYSVRALARSAAGIPIADVGLDKLSGDALDRDTIRNALQDVDAVIQSLGVDFSPQLVFEGTSLFSESTRILVDAMKAAGVKRLITVTGIGAGDSRGHGGFLYDAILFPLLLNESMTIRTYRNGSSGPQGSIGPLCGLACCRTDPQRAATASSPRQRTGGSA